MGQFQDRSLLIEECPRRRGGCRAGARPCAPECQWRRRRRRRGGCCSGARQPCGAAVPGSRGPSPGTHSWRRLVRMQPRRHDGSIGLWNNPCNVKMSGVAYCSILPVCATERGRFRTSGSRRRCLSERHDEPCCRPELLVNDLSADSGRFPSLPYSQLHCSGQPHSSAATGSSAPLAP